MAPEQTNKPWRLALKEIVPVLFNVVTRDELSELFEHRAFYAAWPNGIIAAKVAKAVYEERG